MKKLMTVLLLAPLISGCSVAEKLVAFETERVPLNLEDPPKVEQRDVRFHVITPENQSDVWNELGKTGTDKALFGMTDEHYQNLSLLIADMRGYIIQLRTNIQTYKEYYEPSEEMDSTDTGD